MAQALRIALASVSLVTTVCPLTGWALISRAHEAGDVGPVAMGTTLENAVSALEPSVQREVCEVVRLLSA